MFYLFHKAGLLIQDLFDSVLEGSWLPTKRAKPLLDLIVAVRVSTLFLVQNLYGAYCGRRVATSP
jgi:hypothetical protein